MKLTDKEVAVIAKENVERYTEDQLNAMGWMGSASGAVRNYQRCKGCEHLTEELKCDIDDYYYVAIDDHNCKNKNAIKNTSESKSADNKHYALFECGGDFVGVFTEDKLRLAVKRKIIDETFTFRGPIEDVETENIRYIESMLVGGYIQQLTIDKELV